MRLAASSATMAQRSGNGLRFPWHRLRHREDQDVHVWPCYDRHSTISGGVRDVFALLPATSSSGIGRHSATMSFLSWVWASGPWHRTALFTFGTPLVDSLNCSICRTGPRSRPGIETLHMLFESLAGASSLMIMFSHEALHTEFLDASVTQISPARLRPNALESQHMLPGGDAERPPTNVLDDLRDLRRRVKDCVGKHQHDSTTQSDRVSRLAADTEISLKSLQDIVLGRLLSREQVFNSLNVSDYPPSPKRQAQCCHRQFFQSAEQHIHASTSVMYVHFFSNAQTLLKLFYSALSHLCSLILIHSNTLVHVPSHARVI